MYLDFISWGNRAFGHIQVQQRWLQTKQWLVVDTKTICKPKLDNKSPREGIFKTCSSNPPSPQTTSGTETQGKYACQEEVLSPELIPGTVQVKSTFMKGEHIWGLGMEKLGRVCEMRPLALSCLPLFPV